MSEAEEKRQKTLGEKLREAGRAKVTEIGKGLMLQLGGLALEKFGDAIGIPGLGEILTNPVGFIFSKIFGQEGPSPMEVVMKLLAKIEAKVDLILGEVMEGRITDLIIPIQNNILTIQELYGYLDLQGYERDDIDFRSAYDRMMAADPCLTPVGVCGTLKTALRNITSCSTGAISDLLITPDQSLVHLVASQQYTKKANVVEFLSAFMVFSKITSEFVKAILIASLISKFATDEPKLPSKTKAVELIAELKEYSDLITNAVSRHTRNLPAMICHETPFTLSCGGLSEGPEEVGGCCLIPNDRNYTLNACPHPGVYLLQFTACNVDMETGMMNLYVFSMGPKFMLMQTKPDRFCLVNRDVASGVNPDITKRMFTIRPLPFNAPNGKACFLLVAEHPTWPEPWLLIREDAHRWWSINHHGCRVEDLGVTVSIDTTVGAGGWMAWCYWYSTI